MALTTYETLDVYKEAFELAIRVHELTEGFPKHELYGGMADQIRRSSKSVCANIAEGLSKQMSLPDKKKFIRIALGSTEETRVWLAFAIRLKYMKPSHGESLRDEYTRIAQMLFQLQKKITF
ncbi:MAG: four helix bundle protein [Pseudomonadaceae bacterium]|nr:four helix bundle protein [Pseudomonadaceae bacterium]